MVGVLPCCASFHSEFDMKTTQMNLQHSPTWKLKFYDFELSHNAMDATKNWWNFPWVAENLIIRQGQVGFKLQRQIWWVAFREYQVSSASHSSLVWFGLVLWHINHCRLFNAKSCLFIYIKYIGFGLVGFYGISTIVGYLMPNPIYSYILNIYMICKYNSI